MSKEFFKRFIDDLGDPDTQLAEEGKSSAEFSGYIDSGSYTFNAIVSGSLFCGIPNNKGVVLAGDPSTGKTFFALAIVRHFLLTHPNARVFYFDTESAVTNQMMADRGIDLTRVAKSEPETLEQFRTKAIKLLDKYAALPKEDRFPMMIVLDSLSMLPSSKETTDTTEGKETKDMTKPGVIKGMFRVLRLKMAKLQVPYLITSHVYAVIGAYVPTKAVAGGSGAQYAADTIVLLSKSKDKDADKLVVGQVIHLHTSKSRLSREETKADTRIMYDGGLDKYYGLLPLAEAAGIVKRIGNKYEWPNGTKAFERAILSNPKKFFTDDLMKQLDEYVQTQFKYVAGTDEPETEDEDATE